MRLKELKAIATKALEREENLEISDPSRVLAMIELLEEAKEIIEFSHKCKEINADKCGYCWWLTKFEKEFGE